MLWFYCDDVTKLVVSGGTSPNVEQAQIQPPIPGATLFIIPDGSVNSPFSDTPDFSALKSHLNLKIDAEAGEFRKRFITDTPGQAQTYEKKEVEARGWFTGDHLSNPDKYPFMLAEATVRGVSVEEVRDSIMAQVNMLIPLAAMVEAHRITAKSLISSSSNLPDIINASSVDWDGLFGL